MVAQAIGRLRRVAALVHEWNRHAGPSGMTLHQAMAMHYLVAKGRVLSSQLAAWMGVQRGTVTSLADRMISQGWLRREQDKQDRRRFWLVPTQAGKALVATEGTQLLGPFAARFADWSDDDLSQFCRFLHRLEREQPSDDQGQDDNHQ